MHFWDKINVKELLIEDETHTFPPFTEEELKQTEQSIGWKFPRSYLELLKIQNGGMINFDEFDESWLSVIYGISSKKGSIADMYDNWISGWEYPNIGIPFGETQSAGHDMYFMDFRMVDENGEPRIVLVDNEMGNSVTVVANNLEEFLAKVYHHEEV
ncbi:SMI1/KNR4 family protein [Ruminococcus sp.]|uniref:SMI1/KNR4 family protein n=1 Tax=Ruminococcus sp. TaxID=41978 RepID=UPI002E79019A|nr:SMI1/KNR4 family protein [Ruminococcus sp.]MEE1398718.1 SMI1/KNR4 family protein [Ruminococcus sp.]